MSLTAVLKRMERGGLTQHGFRSTFRDWAGETTNTARKLSNTPAHQLKDKAERANAARFGKRVHLMADWRTTAGKLPQTCRTCQGRRNGTEQRSED
jgi:hypothetical protein